jgi:hypothetical protein
MDVSDENVGLFGRNHNHEATITCCGDPGQIQFITPYTLFKQLQQSDSAADEYRLLHYSTPFPCL